MFDCIKRYSLVSLKLLLWNPALIFIFNFKFQCAKGCTYLILCPLLSWARLLR